MPCRSGSPHGVFSDGACADVCEIDRQTAPTAATPRATVIIVPERRTGMRVSCALRLLLQRILFDADEIGGVVLGGRVWPAALREGEFFDSRRQHHRGVR